VPTDVAVLVQQVAAGDEHAWGQLVERYLPLVCGLIRRHRLHGADADDVSQTVWLRLVEHIGRLREPEALPGWLASTTRNECLRVISQSRRSMPVDPVEHSDFAGAEDPDHIAGLTSAEERQALREALSELPEQRRALLLMLLTDPPATYAEITERLGIPTGSIGPTRARALEQLRGTKAMRALFPPVEPMGVRP